MAHPSRIPGPAILGLSDLFVGAPLPTKKKPTIVVKVPPRPPAKPPTDLKWAKSPVKGRTYVTMVPQKGKTHQESINKAQQVASRAASIAQTASGLARKASTAIVNKTIVGAVAPKKAAGSHLHAVRLAQAAKDVADRAKNLGANAKQNQGSLTAGKARQQQAVKVQKAAYGPSGRPGVPVHVGSADLGPDVMGAVLDAYYETVGAWPDPERPGFLDDGSFDPIILVGEDGTLPPVDPNAPPVDQAAADAALDPADPTYGLGPPPTSAPPLVAGQDYIPGSTYPLEAVLSFPPTDADPRSGLPPGAVLYDPKLKPWGWQAVGSLTRFSPSPDRSDGHGPSGFQWGGGDKGIMDGWYWWWHGARSGTEYKHENAGNSISQAGGYGSGSETMKRRAEVSSQLGWGPLVGSPNDPNFKNLRYDTAGDRWFWFYDEAPAWARTLDPIVGDGALLQKAILDYQTQITAAKADALQAAMQDKADQKEAQGLARQQAKQDAQAALQQSQQQSQQQQAEAAAESQRKIVQMQQETQANALLLQQAQQQLSQTAQAPPGGGYDDGGYDDGSGYGEENEGPRMAEADYDGGYDDESGYEDYADQGEDTAVGASRAAAAGQRALAAAKRVQKTAPRLAASVAKAGQRALSSSQPPTSPRPRVAPLRRPVAPRSRPSARVGEEVQDVYASLADAAASSANLVAQIQDLMSQLPPDLPLVVRGQKIIDQLQLLFGTPIENILSGAQNPMAGVQGMAGAIERLTSQLEDPKTPIGAWVANVNAYLRVYAQQDPEGMDEGGSGGDAVSMPSRGAEAFG